MSGALVRNALQSADEQEKREGTTKVTRYRAGQVPNWVGEEEEEEEEDRFLKGKNRQRARRHGETAGEAEGKDDHDEDVAATPVIIAPGNDRRLQRLAGRSKAAGASSSGRRRERQTETETAETDRGRTEEGGDLGDEDDEVKIRDRRARIRAAQLDAEERQRQGLRVSVSGKGGSEKALPKKEGEGGESSEDSDEYSSEYYSESSDDDDSNALKLAKPVFVSKKDRETIKSNNNDDGNSFGNSMMIQTTWKSTDEVLKRQQETREILKQMAVNEFKGETDGNTFDDIDTDDEKDKAKEYDAWKLRELERLRLEWQAKNGVSDIAEEDLQVKQSGGDRQERAFMQKYYHQGAFFQSVSDNKHASGGVEEVYKKDYASAPTGEDRFNKSVLPEVMQVRNFGKRGRTKWTHLSKEDTSKLADDYRNDARGKRRTRD